MRFSFSPNASRRVERFGRERAPVVVIDDAAADPEELVNDAAARAFSKIGPYYPGVRAAPDPVFTQSLAASVRETIATELGQVFPAWRADCFYSLVTTAPEALQPIQRFPHYDGVETERVAILHFLTKNDYGGTAFYRHKSTGFEFVDVARFPLFRDALERDVAEGGLPPPRYIEDGAPYFERIGGVASAFNRMLIYPGNVLHCSAIDNAARLTADPRNGRLTLNAFLSPAATQRKSP